MTDSKILIYGTYWCSDCQRAKKFFDQHHIEYKWINIDRNKQGEQFVLEVNNGKRIVPTILFPDGSTLVEPSNSELSNKVNTEK